LGSASNRKRDILFAVTASASILLLEDDPELRRMVETMLSSAGFSVVATADAEEAYALYHDAPPSLVIADLMLPRVDGEAFLKRIRNRYGVSAAPTIILLASATRAKVAADLEVASLEKPFAMEELLNTVRRLLPSAASPQAE